MSPGESGLRHLVRLSLIPVQERIGEALRACPALPRSISPRRGPVAPMEVRR